MANDITINGDAATHILRGLLGQTCPAGTIRLVAASNFLCPGQVLERHGVVSHGKFPRDCSVRGLIRFLLSIGANGPGIQFPICSRHVCSVITNRCRRIGRPSVLVIRKVGILRLPDGRRVCIDSFFSFSVCISTRRRVVRG